MLFSLEGSGKLLQVFSSSGPAFLQRRKTEGGMGVCEGWQAGWDTTSGTPTVIQAAGWGLGEDSGPDVGPVGDGWGDNPQIAALLGIERKMKENATTAVPWGSLLQPLRVLVSHVPRSLRGSHVPPFSGRSRPRLPSERLRLCLWALQALPVLPSRRPSTRPKPSEDAASASRPTGTAGDKSPGITVPSATVSSVPKEMRKGFEWCGGDPQGR